MGRLRTPHARAAYAYLLEHNQGYAHYAAEHGRLVEAGFPHGRAISTYGLMMKMPGVEVAVRPHLYPHSAYGDTDLRERLRELGLSREGQQLSVKNAFLRKALSRCKAYAEDFLLAFLIYDIAKAKQVVSICNVAERKHISAEVVSDHYVGSESYWRHEQDILCDVVRIMKDRHRPAYAVDYPGIAAMDLEYNKLCYPIVFIAIAPA